MSSVTDVASALGAIVLMLGPLWLGFLLYLKRSRGFENPIDEIITGTGTTVFLAGFVSFSLALAGLLTFWIIVSVNAAFGILFAGLAKRYEPTQTQNTPRQSSKFFEIAAVATIVLMGIWLYFPPFEEISMHQDGHVYLLGGSLAARTGGFIDNNPVLAQLSPNEREVFFSLPADGSETTITSRSIVPSTFHGFLIVSASDGQVVPQYLHFTPALYGIAFMAGDASVAILLGPTVAILGLLLFWRAVRALSNDVVAGFATVFLGANPLFVWFARYPNPEIIVFGLISTSLLLYSSFTYTQSKVAIFSSFALLGVAAFARVDAILFGAAVLVWLTVMVLNHRVQAGLIGAGAYGVSVGAALVYYSGIPFTYLATLGSILVGDLTPSSRALAWLGWIVLCLSAVTLIIGNFLVPSTDRVIDRRWPIHVATGIMAGAIVAYLAYAFFTRAEAPISKGWKNVEMIGWYWSAAFLISSACSIIYAPVSSKRARVVLILGLLVVGALPYLYHLSNQNLHPWGMRRYVAVLFPAMAFGTAWLIFDYRGIARTIATRQRQIVAVAVVLITLASSLPYTLKLEQHEEFDGLIDETATVAGQIGHADLVIVHQPFTLPSIAPALRYLWGFETIMLWDEPKGSALDTYGLVLERWIKESRGVVAINAPPYVQEEVSCQHPVNFRHVGTERIATPKLSFSHFELATEFVVVSSEFQIYEIVPLIHEKVTHLDAGRRYPGLLCGFYGTQLDGSDPFRWSRGNGFILFSNVSAGQYTLVLDVRGPPPQAAGGLALNISSGGKNWTFSITPIRQEIRLDLNHLETSDITFEFSIPTWRPSDHINSADARDLGFRFYSADLGNGATSA